MRRKDNGLRGLGLVLVMVVILLGSCKSIEKEKQYCIDAEKCYTKEVRIVSNWIVDYINLEAKDSVWLDESALCRDKISRCKELSFNSKGRLFDYYVTTAINHRGRKIRSRGFLMKLDSTKILNGSVQDSIKELYIRLVYENRGEMFKSEEFWSYAKRSREYFANALVYTVGRIDYSSCFQTYIVAILNSYYLSKGNLERGKVISYDDKKLLLLNVRDNVVLSVAEVGSSAEYLRSKSERKGKFFVSELDLSHGDMILCFEKRRELRNKKKSSPPHELPVSKFYFDDSGHLQFAD